MSGHPTWNAFALMSQTSRFLNDHTYSRVVTRNRPLPQIFKDMGTTVEVTRLSHRHIDKARSILDSVRTTPMMVESLLL